MRRVFVDELEKLMQKDPSITVLLGDLGFGIFDELRKKYPDRCINIGSSEQLMVGMAVGMAIEGKIPICYSITPFLLYRPFEFIRNYLQGESIAVKLVGSGRDKDYDEAGFTHHSTDTENILRQLPNIKLFFPLDGEDLITQIQDFIYSPNPSFLSLKK